MTDSWFLRLELCEPIPDCEIDQVREMLLDTLADAGYPAKTTTADWSMVELSRRPFEPFQQTRPHSDTRPRSLG